jgi:penicillin-binding protein 1A
MQVARNYFLSPEKTYARKIKEVLLAFKIEREFSKHQILELYLNKIFSAVAPMDSRPPPRPYYGKNLQELVLPEMAMLAGLPKAPSRDNPLTNPENATERRNTILKQMLNLNFIDDAALCRRDQRAAGRRPAQAQFGHRGVLRGRAGAPVHDPDL